MTSVETHPVGRLDEPVTFQPRLRARDALANYWLRQVTLRLRREICWLWRERGHLGSGMAAGALPPFTSRAADSLDLTRFDSDKRAFFAADVTAAYLSDALRAPPPADHELSPPRRGSFGWAARELSLDPVERFTLAAALLPAIDSACGSVVATCLNDAARTEPTLALIQRLWNEPDDVLVRFDPAHPMVAYGLLAQPLAHWDTSLISSSLVARQLLFPDEPLPASLRPLAAPRRRYAAATHREIALGAGRAAHRTSSGMCVLPIHGVVGAPLEEVAAECAARAGRGLMIVDGSLRASDVAPRLTVAWLRGVDVYLPADRAVLVSDAGQPVEPMPLASLPITVFAATHERAQFPRMPGLDVLAPISVPPLGYGERLALWQELLPAAATDPELAETLAEVARRFRYERTPITRAAAALTALGRRPSRGEVFATCRVHLDVGALAQPVVPRFGLDELMLPPLQTRQLEEMVAAMRNLTRVHYEWGTARAWNESGLSALFAGPPGTGKTTGAEAIAAALDVPIYRIDLSQVVNKYIGETEKNLRRLFDAAESADVVLFFDEADSLFGKRTEVKDAHDRYANLEVSYLLERMERFRGLAILATNRKKDLDEAFLRRLRFLVEFPLPGVDERRRIWQHVIPPGTDASALDLDLLAQRFPLAGGHIRSIVFHACLQSGNEGAPRTLTMPTVIRAVRREYAKLDRAVSLEQFGPYADMVAELGEPT